MNAFANLPFATSRPLTLGVVLELHLVSPRDYALTRAATDLLSSLHHDGRCGGGGWRIFLALRWGWSRRRTLSALSSARLPVRW